MNLEYKIIEKKYYNVKELLKTYFQISDRLLTKLKKNNRILLNNKPVHINTEISCGDIISIDLNFDEESENILPTPMPLNILYEDEAFLIVNKKPSLPVHPSILHFEDSLSNGVKFYFESIGLKRKIRPVNRLDKNTSGIVIFAKNEYIQECLIRQMKNNIFKELENQYEKYLKGTKAVYEVGEKNELFLKSEAVVGNNLILSIDIDKPFRHSRHLQYHNIDNSLYSFI